MTTPEELVALWAEPSHWNRDGSYKCAEDPRLFVPHRGGGGWTLNMDHPRARLAMWGFVAMVIGVVVSVALIARHRAGA